MGNRHFKQALSVLEPFPAAFAANLRAHHGKPAQVESVSMDMCPAFFRGVEDEFPQAQIAFDKFHVIAHASEAIDKMRRLEQKTDPSLKGACAGCC